MISVNCLAVVFYPHLIANCVPFSQSILYNHMYNTNLQLLSVTLLSSTDADYRLSAYSLALIYLSAMERCRVLIVVLMIIAIGLQYLWLPIESLCKCGNAYLIIFFVLIFNFHTDFTIVVWQNCLWCIHKVFTVRLGV